MKTLFALALMMASPQAKAAPMKGFRAGACAGLDHLCFLGGVTLGYARPRAGLRLSLGILAGGAQADLYLSDNEKRVRPYLHAGTGIFLFGLGHTGGGVGADVHLLESKKLVLSAQGSVAHVYGVEGLSDIAPRASIGLNWAFGK